MPTLTMIILVVLITAASALFMGAVITLIDEWRYNRRMDRMLKARRKEGV